jgi:hypothetical protein
MGRSERKGGEPVMSRSEVKGEGPVREAEAVQGEWLKLCERFGSLTDPESLKALASEGFREFGRGVVCLAVRNGQPCFFYLPSYQLQLLLDSSEQKKELLEKMKTYKPENSELLLLVTFNDLDREQTGCYQLFYVAID